MQEREYTQSNRNVVGVFRSRDEAERCISALLNAGFDQSQIGVAMKGREETERLAHDTGVKETHGAEGAASGAGAGAVLGGAAGILAGMGLLAIPGFGPLLAAGPIATGIAGAVGGGVSGGIVGGLIGLGIPEDQAKRYGEEVTQGNILVTVDCGTQCDRAMSTLNSYAAYNVHEYSGGRGKYARSPQREEYPERGMPGSERGTYTKREWTGETSRDIEEETPREGDEPYI